jgi:hypothetical protein
MRPIGVVRSAAKQPSDGCWAGLISTIELYPDQFTPESTAGLEHFLTSRLRSRSIARGGAELFPVSTGTTGLGEGRHLARKTERIGTTVCKIGRVDGTANLGARTGRCQDEAPESRAKLIAAFRDR